MFFQKELKMHIFPSFCLPVRPSHWLEILSFFLLQNLQLPKSDFFLKKSEVFPKIKKLGEKLGKTISEKSQRKSEGKQFRKKVDKKSLRKRCGEKVKEKFGGKVLKRSWGRKSGGKVEGKSRGKKWGRKFVKKIVEKSC